LLFNFFQFQILHTTSKFLYNFILVTTFFASNINTYRKDFLFSVMFHFLSVRLVNLAFSITYTTKYGWMYQYEKTGFVVIWSFYASRHFYVWMDTVQIQSFYQLTSTRVKPNLLELSKSTPTFICIHCIISYEKLFSMTKFVELIGLRFDSK
jgi:hypothetical protein